MNKGIEKLKEEFLAVLPPTLFFFVALHIVGLGAWTNAARRWA